MAFVPGYTHDVFISYAHVDDARIGDASEGWVSTLVGQLRPTLTQKLGRGDALDIWNDFGISLHQGVTQQLLDAVGAAAILIVILSPGYLASEWCLREKDTFLKEIRSGQRSGSRVFIVELDDIDREKRPPELRDLLAYKFWARENGADAPRQFCQAGLLNSDPFYWQYFRALNKLTADLATELTKLSVAPKSVAPTPRRSGSGTRKVAPVFLADPTDDLVDLRDEITQYLDQLGVQVLPERPYARDASFASTMEADLVRCGLFVQLLSTVRGPKVLNEERCYPRLQYDIASKAGKPMLQWRSETIDVNAIKDPDHRALIESETVIAECVEDFKREIRKRLFEDPKREKVPRQAAPGLQALVFVDSDQNDWGLATSISGQLSDLRVDVVLPTWDQSPDLVRQDLENQLQDCDALIVVYGATTATWVRSQLLLCRKAIAKRTQPLQALAVYQGPPKEKPPLNLDFRNLRLLDFSGETTEAVATQLKDFIGQLTSAKQ